jgi:hypothetical protein
MKPLVASFLLCTAWVPASLVAADQSRVVSAVEKVRVVPAAAWLEAVAASLPAAPAGWGAPATDRVLWTKAAARPR